MRAAANRAAAAAKDGEGSGHGLLVKSDTSCADNDTMAVSAEANEQKGRERCAGTSLVVTKERRGLGCSSAGKTPQQFALPLRQRPSCGLALS